MIVVYEVWSLFTCGKIWPFSEQRSNFGQPPSLDTETPKAVTCSGLQWCTLVRFFQKQRITNPQRAPPQHPLTSPRNTLHILTAHYPQIISNRSVLSLIIAPSGRLFSAVIIRHKHGVSPCSMWHYYCIRSCRIFVICPLRSETRSNPVRKNKASPIAEFNEVSIGIEPFCKETIRWKRGRGVPSWCATGVLVRVHPVQLSSKHRQTATYITLINEAWWSRDSKNCIIFWIIKLIPWNELYLFASRLDLI